MKNENSFIAILGIGYLTCLFACNYYIISQSLKEQYNECIELTKQKPKDACSNKCFRESLSELINKYQFDKDIAYEKAKEYCKIGEK